ncbi:MAG: hypothetical protein KAS39_00650 [Actinomycetia bacterium]|nr:hypothetical protein [Actinomycetes bacterium]
MNIIDIEIMEDGVIKVKTKDISEAQHMNADQLLDEITEAMGGTRKTKALEHDFWKSRQVVRQNGKIRIKGKA